MKDQWTFRRWWPFFFLAMVVIPQRFLLPPIIDWRGYAAAVGHTAILVGMFLYCRYRVDL